MISANSAATQHTRPRPEIKPHRLVIIERIIRTPLLSCRRVACVSLSLCLCLPLTVVHAHQLIGAAPTQEKVVGISIAVAELSAAKVSSFDIMSQHQICNKVFGR